MNDFADRIACELDAMWRFALRLTSHQADAEDLVQRTCLKALESAENYVDSGQLRSWLFKIEHRIWLNVLRSRKIRSTSSFANTQLSYASEAKSVDQTSQSDRIAQSSDSPESNLSYLQIIELVDALPDAQRLVVLLVCVEEFTYKEAADILEIPVGTVMSRLSRGRITIGKAVRTINNSKTVAEMDGVSL